MWKFLLSCCFFLSTMSVHGAPHDFYASLVELNQNRESGRVELSIKFFIDDLELALRSANSSPINMRLTDEVFTEEVSAALMEYLEKHFKLKVNGKSVLFDFLGSQNEDDAIWCYLESTQAIPLTGSLMLDCDFLTEIFALQQNVLLLEIGELSSREIFTLARRQETFEF